MKHSLGASIESLGGTWHDATEELLARFALYLVEEAIPAGGIGPIDPEHVHRRHIIDSLLFSGALPSGAETVLDLGTGVGLPGIPVAIIRPSTHFVLLDRSQRRVDLCRRALRILKLTNVEVVHADHRTITDRFPALMMRAVLPVADAWETIGRLLTSGGVAAVGWSSSGRPPDPEAESSLRAAARLAGLEVEVVIPAALDSRAAVLRITST